ncbi:SURF1 family protein [Sphingomonas sp. NBWT7]|uniref:SURF1 family protein n=1 Tax=Sphingomonas sp. NBWT7 TaxID=2596913 RepID=UPI001629F0F1|nr:SURF1 family protein [Sphingomonas sp. NBWT7]QNE30700.1 SURF1 family protein [Sphingomonas sp. NBWT7]
MRRGAFAALCLALTAGFVALGIWQVERRVWKLDLIAKVNARINAAPAELPTDWTADHEYRRVRVRGTFLGARETLVQAVTTRGPGWWVLTPLVTTQPPRGIVLVNRGFVPATRRDPATRQSLGGTVTVTGLIRASEPGGAFLRSNDPAAGRWYSRDVAAIAHVRKLGKVAPVFIDADATPNPGGYPIGGLTVIAFRNTHLLYALTWFALAALSLVGMALVIRGKDAR